MKIHLHGYLKELHSAPINVQASTVAEAVSSLQMLPALQNKDGSKHSVLVDGFGSLDSLYERAEVTEIHIRPVMAGSGRPGMFQILIGVALVGLAVATGGFAIGGITFSQSALVLAGASQILSGVLLLLAPQPQVASAEAQSRYLSGAKNTVRIGTPIPMIYGRRKAYGQYLSFNIEPTDFNSTPEEWYSSPYTSDGSLTFSAAPPMLPSPAPGTYDGQPTSFYTGILVSGEMSINNITQLKFSPQVTLLAGEYDLQFNNGATLHVRNDTAGLSGFVTLLNGNLDTLPPVGTPIIFTRNYV